MKTQNVYATSLMEVLSYAVVMALKSAVKRGILTQEASMQLAADVDFAYMSLASGAMLSVDPETNKLKAEPRPEEPGDETLRIGDD